MRNYGLSYKGSKNKIADKIIKLFPDATNFYDLFAGGCSITHAAILSGKFKNFVINDLDKGITTLFIDAVKGKYKNESRWISREDFFKYRDNDPYIKYLWSFGNTGKTYLYSEEIEPYKKALHYAIVFNKLEPLKEIFPKGDFSFLSRIENTNERRLELQRYFKRSGIVRNTPLQTSADVSELLQNFTRLQSLERLEALERLQGLEALERLQGLEALERLQGLEALERLQAFNLSYEEINIKADSVIYCDIPYKDTDGYNGLEFDFEAFYKWSKQQNQPLFISSYEMPESDFITVAEIPHQCTLTNVNHYEVIERVFIPRHQLGLYQASRPQPLLFDDFLF